MTVTKILEPRDRHIASVGRYTIASSPAFSSTSEHLFNARDILQRSGCSLAFAICHYSNCHNHLSDLNAVEVFSRGQNPQHWHIGRRELEVNGDEGEVYMEVARKETTLTDVDNELASIIKRLVE